MNFDATLRFVSLAKHYLGDDAAWWLAVIMRESAGNEYAIGDQGLAVGIGQQHPSFQETWYPVMPDGVWSKTDQRWHPAFQTAVFQRFWVRHEGQPPHDRILRYHYGHLTTDTLKDPDRYWPGVQLFYSSLVRLLA